MRLHLYDMQMFDALFLLSVHSCITGVALISHAQTQMFVEAIDLNTAGPVQLLASPEGDANENLLSASLCKQ